jgi:hypothetical protein
MTFLPLEARLALEWFNASGERTAERLSSLVNHFCDTNGIHEAETRASIQRVAHSQARFAEQPNA